MKRSITITRAAIGLILAAILQLSPAAYAEPLAHERAFADAELADAMVGSLSGGAQGLPKMDQITAAAIAADVANGEFASAFRRVRDYLISKGVAATLGQTASGFMAAVSAGEALGVRAQEHFGRGRLNALYTNLSRDTNAASWPATYQEALRDDVLGQRIDAAILPVVHWLRRQTGQTGSDRYFAEMAYGMMVARRDFEQGCARYGLSGGDCTPERLADEEAWHLERIARTHAAEHAADLRLLETARLVREEAEANRARERAERALREAEAQEAALAREAELAAERAAEEAEAAAARAEAAREALAALRAQHALPPPAALPPSAISADIVDTETSENRTLYRVRLTNTASEPIFGVAVDARMRTPAADSGVAIASGGELRTLAPGESLEVSFTGDGALDAVRLYVTGAGQLLGSFDYPMLHESAARDEDMAGDEWITVPAVYRGTVTTHWTASLYDQAAPGQQDVSGTYTCEASINTIDIFRIEIRYHPCIYTYFHGLREELSREVIDWSEEQDGSDVTISIEFGDRIAAIESRSHEYMGDNINLQAISNRDRVYYSDWVSATPFVTRRDQGIHLNGVSMGARSIAIEISTSMLEFSPQRISWEINEQYNLKVDDFLNLQIHTPHHLNPDVFITFVDDHYESVGDYTVQRIGLLERVH